MERKAFKFTISQCYYVKKKKIETRKGHFTEHENTMQGIDKSLTVMS